LDNLIITSVHLYRAQYITGRQSCLTNEDQVTCAVGITDQNLAIYHIFESAVTTK